VEGGRSSGRSHEAERNRAKPALGLVERGEAPWKEDGHPAGRTRHRLCRGMQRSIRFAQADGREGGGIVARVWTAGERCGRVDMAATSCRQVRVGERVRFGGCGNRFGSCRGGSKVARVHFAALCQCHQAPVIKGESSPALECPSMRAPDEIVSREGGRLAGRTNDRWCHESVVRAHHERVPRAKSPGDRGYRKVPVETRRPNPKPGRLVRSGASGAGMHRIDVGPRVTSTKGAARLRTATGGEALRSTCGTTSGGAGRPKGSIGSVGGKTSEGKTPQAPPA
jgi:hypothetical protein